MINYHKNFGFQIKHIKEVQALIESLNKQKKRFSFHALQELNIERDCQNIGKHIFNYVLNWDDIFEIGIDNNILSKIGFRIHYNNENDIIFILSVKNIIITNWINKKSDIHLTLNKNNYCSIKG